MFVDPPGTTDVAIDPDDFALEVIEWAPRVARDHHRRACDGVTEATLGTGFANSA